MAPEDFSICDMPGKCSEVKVQSSSPERRKDILAARKVLRRIGAIPFCCCGSMRRLNNKTAIISGGAHGIGRAISELFAQEGAAVFILDLDEPAGAELTSSLRRRDGNAVFIRTDVSLEEEAARAIRLAAAQTQRIDVL